MEWMAISGYRLPPLLQQQNQDAGGGMANKPAATGQSVGVGVGGPGSLMGVGGHGVPPGSSGPPEMCPPHGGPGASGQQVGVTGNFSALVFFIKKADYDISLWFLFQNVDF